MQESKVINEKQVAEIVGFSVPWVRKQRYEGGSIPYFKVGRSVRYRRADVEAWVDMMGATT